VLAGRDLFAPGNAPTVFYVEQFMAEFKNILFPIDFSPASEEVAPHVVALAERFKSRVTALSVLDLPTARYLGFQTLSVWSLAEIDQMREEQRKSLNAFVGERLPAIDVGVEAGEGEAALVITAAAERDGSDLIMMPTHGMGPFRRFLLGSVTAKVLNDASCPVWTSAHRDDRPLPRPVSSGPVLCAVNLEAESVPLLRFATAFAPFWSTTLHVLHVIPAVDELSKNRGVVAVRKYHFEKARQNWVGIRNSANVDADLMLAGGGISRAVADTAQKMGATVVVIARGKMQKPLGGLRTWAYAIIRESPSPVIAV
jgi:nucleotide-binding universal stress UspA family protein